MDVLEEPLKTAVIINTHENSPVFKDTLDSVRHNLTKDVLVVVDAFGWGQFEGQDLPAYVLQGFHHGKSSSPHRNMALGLMQAWQIWPGVADWYCYMDYDCLVGQGDISRDLAAAHLADKWILGNDHRKPGGRIPFLDNFVKAEPEINYLLGCCLFFNAKFMRALNKLDFFTKFLHYTNFFTNDAELIDDSGKKHMVYDIGEYLYPTLAVQLGGSVEELACWQGLGRRGRHEHYPMRFQPDIAENEIHESACVIHPVKDADSPVRKKYRALRELVR